MNPLHRIFALARGFIRNDQLILLVLAIIAAAAGLLPFTIALALAALCCVFWVLFLQGSPSQGASPAEHHAPIVFAVLVAACAAARCANAAKSLGSWCPKTR